MRALSSYSSSFAHCRRLVVRQADGPSGAWRRRFPVRSTAPHAGLNPHWVRYSGGMVLGVERCLGGAGDGGSQGGRGDVRGGGRVRAGTHAHTHTALTPPTGLCTPVSAVGLLFPEMGVESRGPLPSPPPFVDLDRTSPHPLRAWPLPPPWFFLHNQGEKRTRGEENYDLGRSHK